MTCQDLDVYELSMDSDQIIHSTESVLRDLGALKIEHEKLLTRRSATALPSETSIKIDEDFVLLHRSMQIIDLGNGEDDEKI